MKKMGKLIAIGCMMAVMLVTGCGNAAQTAADDGAKAKLSNAASVSDVIEEQMAKADQEKSEESIPAEDTANANVIAVTDKTGETTDSEEKTENAENTKNAENEGNVENARKIEDTEVAKSVEEETDGIDVDLTALSSTMVYSEVYNMMTEPQEYIGKTVKMDGVFTLYHDESTDVYYFACMVQDATACCSQGIEFVLTEDYKYPEDYPEVGDEICVTGVFDTYKEGDTTYCTLRNARLV